MAGVEFVWVVYVMCDAAHFICGYISNAIVSSSSTCCVYLLTVAAAVVVVVVAVVVVSHDLFNRISYACLRSASWNFFLFCNSCLVEKHARAKGYQNSCWCKSFGYARTHTRTHTFRRRKADNNKTDWLACWLEAKQSFLHFIWFSLLNINVKFRFLKFKWNKNKVKVCIWNLELNQDSKSSKANDKIKRKLFKSKKALC